MVLRTSCTLPHTSYTAMCSCASLCGKCVNALTEDTIMDQIDGLMCTTLLRFVQFSFHKSIESLLLFSLKPRYFVLFMVDALYSLRPEKDVADLSKFGCIYKLNCV
jgi:hypothetical protein